MFDKSRIFTSFYQSESDLQKIVALDTACFKNLSYVNDETIDQNTAINQNINSVYKRKRVEETLPNSIDIYFQKPNSQKQEIIKMLNKTNIKSDFYNLSHLVSLNLFYLHSSDAIKNIEMIDELIQDEVLQNRLITKQNRKAPNLQTTVYGVFNETINGVINAGTYCRVRLLSKVLVVQNSNSSDAFKCEKDELFVAFYLDYGKTNQVYCKDLIALSDTIQKIKPQAICCHLYGLQNLRMETFLTDSENKENSLSFNKILTALDDDEHFIKASNLLNKLLCDKPFMASTFKRFSESKTMDNFLPLQTDNNAKPIEVVIHLFEKNELEMLKRGDRKLNEIKQNKEELKFRDVCYLIKHMLGQNKSGVEGSISLKDHSAKDRDKIDNFDLKNHLDANKETTVMLG